jgi:hypothetical protein
MRQSVVLLTAIVLLVPVRAAAAQRQSAPPSRVYTTLGLSKGAGALTCQFCTGEGKGGFAGFVGIQKTMAAGVHLGGEADWWMHSGGGSTRSVLAVAPVAHLYLSKSSPLFIKIGLGVARFTASSEEEELRTTTVAGVTGAGYEFRLANHFVVIPYLSWMGGRTGTMRLNGAEVTHLGGVSLLQYGVALSKR